MLQTEIAMATRRRPENLTAYDFYLRAMPQYYLATREGLAEAIRLAHRALELDPRFGSVAALAGVCHMLNVILGYSNDPQFDRKEAVRLVRLALSIDDGDPDTLARASVISAFMVGDSEAEIEMADRAVALNPNSWITWNCRGHVYRIAGLPEEAIRSFERAIRMSPVDPRLHMTLTGIGLALIELRRFDEAIVVGKKALRQNPPMWQLTTASRPPSPISDVTLRRTTRRRVCLRSIPPLQYRRLSPGADNQTQSCLLRVFGKRGCPNSPVRSTDEAIWHIAAPDVCDGTSAWRALPDVEFSNCPEPVLSRHKPAASPPS